MSSVAAAILLTALALLARETWAQEGNGSRAGVPGPLQPGIGAHDPRIRVDPDAVPWRAVGKIQVASVNFRTECTATLVAQSTVVTAAHCLFNRRTGRYFPPGSLHFLIGYDGSGYSGHAVGISMKVGDGYDPARPKETIGSDWALVLLDKKLGSADRVLPLLSDLPENGASVMLGGYQQDHPLILMADTRCVIGGRLVDVSGRLLLRHSCVGTRGVSGAPLLINSGDQWHVAAIEVAAEVDHTGGVAIGLKEAILAALVHQPPPSKRFELLKHN
jgi:protease YdgD